jgi:hypothetical protein
MVIRAAPARSAVPVQPLTRRNHSEQIPPVERQNPFRLVVAPGSGRPVVLVDCAAEDSSSPDGRVERDRDGRIMLRRTLAQALVRAMSVEVRDVLVEDLPGVALVVDQHPVGALAANGPDEPLDAAAQAHDQVADLLRGPLSGGCSVTPSRCTLSCPDLHRDEHVQPAQQNGVDMEEVDRQQSFRLGAEEGPPLRVHTAGRRPEPAVARLRRMVPAPTWWPWPTSSP